MAPPITNRNGTSATLGTQLAVLRFVDSGHSQEEAASEHHIDLQSVRLIVGMRDTLESFVCQPRRRHNLTMEDKLKVLHWLEKDHSYNQTSQKFKIGKRTVARIAKNREMLLSLDESRACLSGKRPFQPKHPEVEKRVTSFITFVRQQRLPVTLSLLRTRAKMAAGELGIYDFKASDGWIRRYRKRHGLGNSIRLHGKGDVHVSESALQRMEEIRKVMEDYELCNIYNQDESGLMYRMGPNRTYTAPFEHRQEVRGTNFQNFKQRITVSMCVNGDGTHRLPVKYIGKSVTPVCFQDHPDARYSYTSQRNGWIDGSQFEIWLNWWYNEVQKRSNGPWLLLLDNCNGHDVNIDLPGVRVEFLPPNMTSKFQPLDMGLIAQAKIRYRSKLLRAVIHIVTRRASGEHQFKDSSGRGRWGIREGQLPHIADAISTFNESWNETTQECVLKCWMKSKCLPDTHVREAKRILQSMQEDIIDVTSDTPRLVPTTEISTQLDQPINESLAQEIYDASLFSRFNTSSCPVLEEYIKEIASCDTAAECHSVLNSPAPYDEERIQDTLTDAEVQELFDKCSEGNQSTSEENAEELLKSNFYHEILSSIQQTQSMVWNGEYRDAELEQVLQHAVKRIHELISQN